MISTIQKNALYVVIGSLVFTAILLFLLPNPASDISEKALISIDLKESDNLEETRAKKKTIANAWQWNNTAIGENNSSMLNTEHHDEAKRISYSAEFPFTQESVYQALHSVNLDNNGDVILDNDALIALNAALDHSELTLDSEALFELQSLIKTGLPGSAGEQTAQIVADYYQYLGAKNEFNSLYETSSNHDKAIENYETQYNELIALREVYLGADVAEKLFSTSDANSRYMFESMKIEANASLSEAEKKQAQANNIAEHEAKTINVTNWRERYQAFLDEKNYIINSSISDAQKRQQLTNLMSQHFSYQELESVSHLNLESL